MSLEDADQSVDRRVDLAVLRSELAWDRTLLAWVRTVLTLMGAGVAFDKGAQLLHEARLAAGTAVVQGAHLIGLCLTGVSTLLLPVVCLQYWQSSVRWLGPKDPRFRDSSTRNDGRSPYTNGLYFRATLA